MQGQNFGPRRDNVVSIRISKRERDALHGRARYHALTLSDELRYMLAMAPGVRPPWLIELGGRYDLWGDHGCRASLRVTDDELDALRTDARRWGLGLAGYLRSVVECGMLESIYDG